jgi:hypothetical protein
MVEVLAVIVRRPGIFIAMPRVRFQPRYELPEMCDPDVHFLRDLILRPCEPGRTFGEAALLFEGDATQSPSKLILIHDDNHGYYLKYIDSTKAEWLSLGDASRLLDLVTPDEWQASVGLFLSPTDAWSAIEDFLASGTRSPRVEWIRPQEMPDGSNW